MSADLNLTDYLPYLLNRAGSRIATSFTRELRGFDISLQMWRTLAALHHADGQRIGGLAALTSIDVSTLSRMVGGLEKKGLVRRRRTGSADGDARIVTVHLTGRGRALTERIIPLALAYEHAALAGFDGTETVMLKGMLRRLYRNMDALAGLASTGPLAAE